MFPYESIRPVQQKVMDIVQNALNTSDNAIIHAPTGIGKTAAVLTPAVEYAIKHKKIIFFLTSRHTQHLQAIQTLRDIQKLGHQFTVVDLIAKQKLCLKEHSDLMNATEFSRFCKDVREAGQCKHFNNTRLKDGRLKEEAKPVAEQLEFEIYDTEDLMNLSSQHRMCAYELATEVAKKATVIIADYSYIFNEAIRMPFLIRIQKDLEDTITIVDEAHNLPNRIKDLASSKLSTYMLKRAMREADKEKDQELYEYLHEMLLAFETLFDAEQQQEQVVDQTYFNEIIKEIQNYDQIIESLEQVGEQVRQKSKQSALLGIAHFMNEWKQEEEGFTRILSLDMSNEPTITLSKKCLDPSLISESIVKSMHSTILMSGTLHPPNMYADILGIKGVCKAFSNPFPKHNALHWVLSGVTTKWNTRNTAQYKKIASYISNIINDVPGSSAVFFPSYELMKNIVKHVESDKPLLKEQQGWSKEVKAEFLEQFRAHKKEGAVLLAAATGSYGEGIDLPGDQLQCVIIVGLPLAKPDAETNELIRYYDKKFGKGWEYGYTYPALNITMQNAGRCIRSETDRGLIVYMDDRYHYTQYRTCIPEGSNVTTTDKFALTRMFFEQE